MQYLGSVLDDTAGLATPDEQAAIDVFNDRLKAEDQWIFAETPGNAADGLGTPADAPRYLRPRPSAWLVFARGCGYSRAVVLPSACA